MHERSAAAALLSLFAAPLAAQAKVGDDVPSVIVDESVNFPVRIMDLADLRGAVVLIVYWSSWADSCRKEVPHMNELHKTFAERGLVVVGVTSEDLDVVRSWVEQTHAAYPIACESGGFSKKQLGIESVPHAILVTPDGKIAWSGYSASLPKETVEKALADAVPLFGRFADQLAPVQDLLDKHQDGRAMPQAQALLQGGTLDGKSAQLATFTVRRLEAEAKSMRRRNWPWPRSSARACAASSRAAPTAWRPARPARST